MTVQVRVYLDEKTSVCRLLRVLGTFRSISLVPIDAPSTHRGISNRGVPTLVTEGGSQLGPTTTNMKLCRNPGVYCSTGEPYLGFRDV